MLVILACLYVVVMSALVLMVTPQALSMKELILSESDVSLQIGISFFRALAFVVLWQSSSLSFKGPLLVLLLAVEVYRVIDALYYVGKTQTVKAWGVAVGVALALGSVAACVLFVTG